MAETFKGLSGFVDDIFIYDTDAVQHAHHVRTFLQRCAEAEVLRSITWIVSLKQLVSFTWHGGHVLVCACKVLPLA